MFRTLLQNAGVDPEHEDLVANWAYALDRGDPTKREPLYAYLLQRRHLVAGPEPVAPTPPTLEWHVPIETTARDALARFELDRIADLQLSGPITVAEGERRDAARRERRRLVDLQRREAEHNTAVDVVRLSNLRLQETYDRELDAYKSAVSQREARMYYEMQRLQEALRAMRTRC